MSCKRELQKRLEAFPPEADAAADICEECGQPPPRRGGHAMLTRLNSYQVRIKLHEKQYLLRLSRGRRRSHCLMLMLPIAGFDIKWFEKQYTGYACVVVGRDTVSGELIYYRHQDLVYSFAHTLT